MASTALATTETAASTTDDLLLLANLGTGDVVAAPVAAGSSSGHSLKLIVDLVDSGEFGSVASALDSNGEMTSLALELKEGGSASACCWGSGSISSSCCCSGCASRC